MAFLKASGFPELFEGIGQHLKLLSSFIRLLPHISPSNGFDRPGCPWIYRRQTRHVAGLEGSLIDHYRNRTRALPIERRSR